MQIMQITPLSKHIGAEVTGIDLRQPLDDATRKSLNAAVVEHVALVIRDQEFTPQQYLAAISNFGEPMPQHFTQYSLPDCPLVCEVSNRHQDKAGKRVPAGITSRLYDAGFSAVRECVAARGVSASKQA